jgi:addiction module RelE/StbE family toxin
VKIFYTEEAQRRLRDIYDYYSAKAGKKVAQKIINDLLEETELLEQNPNLGIVEELLITRKNKYYSLIINNYKVIYRIENSLIIISTVFDTR